MRQSLATKPRLCFLVLALSGLVGQAQASGNPFVKQEELSLLSEWCLHIPWLLGRREPAASAASPLARAELDQIRATGCLGVHHYCWGLVYLNRARFAADARGRRVNAGYVAGEMDYVTNASSDTCTLIPDMHINRGDANFLLNEMGTAARHYLEAIALAPDRVMAYGGLSRVYQRLNQDDEAIAILKQGLEANPDSRFLQRRLERLQ